ncbi:translocase of the inner membrane [Ceratobasidium sp. 395]|nr:translocase of the inner membrane [Ceratobasidium sp. 395]
MHGYRQCTTPETNHLRDPCPYVILNDTGSAFAMGAIGGAIWHGTKGAHNSPKGHRFESVTATIKARAPIAAGKLAAWGGLFSAFHCVSAHYRRVEDRWNSLFSIVATGGILAAKGGPRAAAGSAIACGVLLGTFEGVSVVLTHLLTDVNRPAAPPRELLADLAFHREY